MEELPSVIIVGAGISGLAAASRYLLCDLDNFMYNFVNIQNILIICKKFQKDFTDPDF